MLRSEMKHRLIALTLFTNALVGPAVMAADEASDHLRMCVTGNQNCEANRMQFRNEYPKAYARDYQSQRNVSYCLASGCDGAVTQNRPLGCAWRIVIIGSGSPKVDSTDTEFFKAYCIGRLNEIEVAQMRAQAGALFKEIYKRPLPAFLDP